ncbi:MAG TPA: IS1 family transposase [Mucilaginibacter sp.]|jgi:IS1 family transposase/transposase-like protein|nr:IS1 family transposase [Mucilaginibacter sp.]
MPCIKEVGGVSCQYCQSKTIKFGKARGSQRYRCKKCRKIQLAIYKKHAYQASVNTDVATHVKEGCGIRSIARLLHISANTVLRRIKRIAYAIQKPAILSGQICEVDELRTYIQNKSKECWIIYALNKQNGQVIDFKVGRRTKDNIRRVADTLLLANCKQVYTDRLKIYRELIPEHLHSVRRYGTNKIERKNLSLRVHLKRLNRKTICFSKNLMMLDACLKIYFWYAKESI